MSPRVFFTLFARREKSLRAFFAIGGCVLPALRRAYFNEYWTLAAMAARDGGIQASQIMTVPLALFSTTGTILKSC